MNESLIKKKIKLEDRFNCHIKQENDKWTARTLTGELIHEAETISEIEEALIFVESMYGKMLNA